MLTGISIVSAPAVAGLAWLHLLAMPCFPGHFAYFIYTSCNDNRLEWKLFPDWILRIFIPSGMIWLILHGVSFLAMESVIYTCLHCFCLTNYHYLFWRKSQFSCRTERLVQIFKEIQLFATYCMTHGSALSVPMTVFITSNFIMSLYVMVGLEAEIPFSLL